jgi:hypothetical protein
MNSEKEIVLALLIDVKKQLEEGGSAEATMDYVHPKWGNLIFKLNTREIDDPDFETGTLALEFFINECCCSLKAGQRKKILDDIKKYITDTSPILKHVPNCYRGLFESRYLK